MFCTYYTGIIRSVSYHVTNLISPSLTDYDDEGEFASLPALALVQLLSQCLCMFSGRHVVR